jgi:methyl-accepting chemotaxis protein
VHEGAKLVQDAAGAIRAILTKVSEINRIVSAIAGDAKLQAAGLDQVNAMVARMDQMTQKNAIIAEESASASVTLREESDGLNRLMGEFKSGAISGGGLRKQEDAGLRRAS